MGDTIWLSISEQLRLQSSDQTRHTLALGHVGMMLLAGSDGPDVCVGEGRLPVVVGSIGMGRQMEKGLCLALIINDDIG